MLWLSDELATLQAGARLARALGEPEPVASREVASADSSAGLMDFGLHIHLIGHLGAGKTTLVRGLLREMGVVGAVKSPTYTLVEPYQSARWEVFHFDLYRLGEAEELELIGARDYFRAGALCLFEWPSNGIGAIPEPSLKLTLSAENGGRRLSIDACDSRGEALKSALKAEDNS
ncbi:MAG: tRNA threonylcarbamoyladenosine biosynthesis protein TsaE [Gammaproteobacteria bacterium]|jgi:tRNA threonylcarbamoyladenosine biosynthesis protein TsaE